MGPLALALVAQVGTATNAVEIRFATGAEWDTNAQRAVSSGSAPIGFSGLQIVGDGLVRVTGQVSGQLAPTRRTGVWLRYQLGAKRFFRQQSEDFLSHQFVGQGAWSPTGWMTLGVAGSFRLSRLHSELRDYNLGNGNVSARVFLSDDLSLSARGAFTGYRFLFDDHFDFRGPSAGGGVTYRLFSGLWLDAGVDHHWRFFDQNGFVEGFVIGTGEPKMTRCDPPAQQLLTCTPLVPEETEVDLTGGVQYLGSFRVSARYRLRIRRSTSPYENIDRHRISLEGTIPIVDRLTANIAAIVQLTAGTSARDDVAQSEDDENRNNLTVGIRYALTDTIAADFRYSLYLDLFKTNEATYRRQLFYLGLGYRTGLLSL